MCAIAGIYTYAADGPPVDRDELLRVREHMIARGPDGSGLWISADGRLGMAHRRLAIIELTEAGAQPMLDPETGNHIVFNGEIYNHAELREYARGKGAVVRSHSDTEVLLKLYALEGEAMLRRLRGMFAFALWDASRRELFMARDTYGIKPLYIADDGKTLRFASQVKALLQGRVDTRPEPAGHAGFLLWGSVPEPYTLYRGIRALPPGHWLRLSADGARRELHCFDSPAAALREVRVSAAGDEAPSLQATADAVRDSVAAHMVADVPVGVFLSAGLDSTMIAASAAHLGRLRTLTLGFDAYAGSEFDEASLAEQVASSLKAEHSLHRIGATDFAADREALLSAMDQPTIDGVNTWFVAKVAAQQGLKVALSGIGGDELFGSYPSFHQVPQLRRRIAPLAGLPLLGKGLRRGLHQIDGVLPSPKYAGLVEYGGTLAGSYLLRRSLFMPWELPGLMDPAMAAEGLDELDTLGRLEASRAGLESERLAISAFEMQWYMRNQLLRDADWAGMAHSLEIRVPLVDTTLVRHFVELPGVPAKEEKRRVACAVAPELPVSVLTRPKTGFAVPIYQWLNPGAPPSAFSLRGWARQLHARFSGEPVRE